MTDDEAHMRRAIVLARANLGLTAENPSVGCVIVSGGAVVGEGATAPGGRPHAEEQAVDQAADRARGATAYVTLEPCGQRSTGAASCSERLAAAGVERVVIACEDDSVFAAGRGLQRLRDAGLQVETGVLREEAAQLYLSYHPARHATSGES